MGKILIGLCMVLLEFNINMETAVIGLIPDFIGYILLVIGLKEMASESSFFQKAIPLSAGMTIYSAICYLLDLFGITGVNDLIIIILGIINTASFFYILYLIIRGIEEMQTKSGRNLYTDSLNNIWLALLILNAGAYLLIFIPILSLICIISSSVATIVLVWYIYKAKEEYYKKVLK